MKFTLEVLVDAPLDHVLALLADPEHSKQWQPEIQDIQWLSGTPGAAGSTCRYHLRLPNGRNVTADETFIRRDPDGTEESVGVTNGIECRMLGRPLPTPDGRVCWIVEHDLRMHPIRAAVAFFFSPLVRRQSQTQFDRFAAWAELTHKDRSGV
ncbi:SRPBCC family protein [Paeniglutamicibacter cryotolerans]|uniref:SRPBCC family protein n=1 Tax=Paeniglutamicibacter cryotolerans TaxID=670079 RepID=A0A839QMV3_9MICC|nr:SRPBCC family protein [Paeniglutamicibacter cryotolerans]MBB2997227.1 hypothetical protein [Paeniglutamicibacter cryotolerans]